MGRKVETPPPEPKWDQAPPDASERQIHVMGPRVGVPLRAIVVASQAVGVLTHWFADPAIGGKGRTVPHTEPKKGCYCCAILDQLPRWKGYLACYHWTLCRHIIVDLTLNSVQTCPALFPDGKVDLRGRTILLKRIGNHAQAPVRAELEGDPLPEEQIPATFDVRRSLERLWGSSSSRKWRAGEKALTYVPRSMGGTKE